MASERRRSGRLGVPRGNPVQGMVDGVIGVAGKLGAPCLAVASRSDAEQSGTSQV